MPINRRQLMDDLRLEIGREMRTDIRPKRFAEEVRDHWQGIAMSPANPHPATKTGPYSTGAYRASIKVRQMRIAKGSPGAGRFLPTFEVYTTSPIAHFLEYGTGIDAEGTHSPWGRFTPTHPYAFALKTALHFHGTPG